MRVRSTVIALILLTGIWDAAIAASWLTEDTSGAGIPMAAVVGIDVGGRVKLTCVEGEAILVFSASDVSAKPDDAALISVTGPSKVRTSIPATVRLADQRPVAVAEGPLVVSLIQGISQVSQTQKWSIGASILARRNQPIETQGRPPELDNFIAACRKIVPFPSAVAPQKSAHRTLLPKARGCSALAKYACSAPCKWVPGQTIDGRHIRGRCVAP